MMSTNGFGDPLFCLRHQQVKMLFLQPHRGELLIFQRGLIISKL